MKYATSMTYKRWMEEVDKCVKLETFGEISVADLGDFNSYDAWRAKTPPAQAARDALENDDLGSMFFALGE